MSVDHYENFPVASILMPKRLRKPVEAIYHFARAADDIADESVLSDALITWTKPLTRRDKTSEQFLVLY